VIGQVAVGTSHHLIVVPRLVHCQHRPLRTGSQTLRLMAVALWEFYPHRGQDMPGVTIDTAIVHHMQLSLKLTQKMVTINQL